MCVDMNPGEWHCKYLERLTEAGLSYEEAFDILVAGIGGYDYEEDDPESEADAELSYWSDND